MRTALLLAILFAAPIAAQPTVDLGFRVGVNASAYSLSFDEADVSFDSNRELGFEAAITAEVRLTDLIEAIAEAGYAHRRFSVDLASQFGPQPDSDPEMITLGSSYGMGTLGLLGRLSPFGQRRLSPYLLAGPRLDLFLSANDETGTISFPDRMGTIEREVSNQFEDLFVDAGLSGLIGLGLAWQLPSGPMLRLETRYDRTLTDPFSGNPPATRQLNSFSFSTGMTW